MNGRLILGIAIVLAGTGFAGAQETGVPAGRSPIYHVTVIQRTVRAVNYQYRSGPTGIDFQGTVLLPAAKGEAVVESKEGRTEIDAKFRKLDSPQKFGTGYLTYVLWAISPEGHAKNLGELVPGSSDHANIHVTTDFQAFGLIVTAEPYSAVRQPSDVVVLENRIRPDTIGKSEPIDAKYELLPRGHYTYTLPDGAQEPGGPKVSMSRYESTLEVYQAQNAVQIAQSLGAEQYAPDVYRKATVLLRNAQDLNARKAERSEVVMAAREAAQTAEDARMIALKRQQQGGVAEAQQQAAHEKELRMQAEAQAQTAQAEASASRQLLDRERAARERAEAEASAARTAAAQVPPPAPQVVVVEHTSAPAPQPDPQKAALRVNLVQQLSDVFPTVDTPRGVVITLDDANFRSTALRPGVESGLSRIAALLVAHPGLSLEVDGNTDNGGNPAADERFSYDRAIAVQAALERDGVAASRVSARGLGAERPVTANNSAAGREQNRRVEIVVSGNSIGTMAHWDKTYPLLRK